MLNSSKRQNPHIINKSASRCQGRRTKEASPQQPEAPQGRHALTLSSGLNVCPGHGGPGWQWSKLWRARVWEALVDRGDGQDSCHHVTPAIGTRQSGINFIPQIIFPKPRKELVEREISLKKKKSKNKTSYSRRQTAQLCSANCHRSANHRTRAQKTQRAATYQMTAEDRGRSPPSCSTRPEGRGPASAGSREPPAGEGARVTPAPLHHPSARAPGRLPPRSPPPCHDCPPLCCRWGGAAPA